MKDLEKGDDVAVRGTYEGATASGRSLVKMKAILGSFPIEDDQLVRPVAGRVRAYCENLDRAMRACEEQEEAARRAGRDLVEADYRGRRLAYEVDRRNLLEILDGED